MTMTFEQAIEVLVRASEMADGTRATIHASRLRQVIDAFRSHIEGRVVSDEMVRVADVAYCAEMHGGRGTYGSAMRKALQAALGVVK